MLIKKEYFCMVYQKMHEYTNLIMLSLPQCIRLIYIHSSQGPFIRQAS